jgi:uncharacterized membrane protein YhaH (DUF805 family)
MFCSQCGTELDDSANFCSGCGNQTSTSKSGMKKASVIKSSASSVSYQAKAMTFTESIGACYSKFFEFSGRASRSEYWWFYLFILLLTWGAKLIATITMPEDETGVYAGVILESLVLFATIPTYSAGVRRLHDVGKSGWNYLWLFTIIGIIPIIIWTCREGSKTQNEYDTKETNNTLAIIIVILSTLFTIGLFFFQANKELGNDFSMSANNTNQDLISKSPDNKTAKSNCYNADANEPKSLEGKLTMVTFPGPPNYEDVTQGDTPEVNYILESNRSFCVFSDLGSFDDVTQAQIMPLNNTVGSRMETLLGQKVRVQLSDQYTAHTGHHHAPLLASVNSIDQTN